MTQETALKILQTGANVFLTGEPGSGKTYMALAIALRVPPLDAALWLSHTMGNGVHRCTLSSNSERSGYLVN